MVARHPLLLSLLGFPVIALGLAFPGPGVRDPNRERLRPPSLPAPADFDQVFQGDGDDTRPVPLAKAFFPGPAGSFTITLSIRNDSAASITNVVVDLFESLDGEALVAESVFFTSPGTSVLYPLASGRGPIVVSFQGFDPGEVVSMSFDPDTYEDANFGATVGDLVGARIGVVFSDGRKGLGVFHATPSGDTVAEVDESSP